MHDARVRRGRTSGAAPPTSPRATVVVRRAGAQPEPHRRARRDRRRRASRSSPSRRSRCSRPATRSSQPGQPLGARPDLRHQSIHARDDRRAPRRHRASPLPTVGDTIDALARARSTRRVAHDIVVFSGGSSVGERDLILDVLRARGERASFTASRSSPASRRCSARSAGTPVFGMPGYPTSCLSNAYMLLVPFLRKMARLPPWEPRTIDAAARPPHRLSAGPASVLHGARRRTAAPSPRSRRRATSRAWRTPTATSKFRSDVDIVEAGTVVTVKFF